MSRWRLRTDRPARYQLFEYRLGPVGRRGSLMLLLEKPPSEHERQLGCFCEITVAGVGF